MKDEVTALLECFRNAERKSTETPLTARALRAEQVLSEPHTLAAADSEGRWTLVVVTRASERGIPGLRLRHLSIDYGVAYQLHLDGDIKELRISVIKCESSEDAIRGLFAAFCVTLKNLLPPNPTDDQLAHEVEKWHSLFWQLQSPPQASVVGFIGELTLLDCVGSKRDWIRAWHNHPMNNLDFAFNAPSLSVEVKATSSQQRVHSISLHQAMPLETETHFFASVIAELRETGVPVRDVIQEISDELTGTPEFHLFWKIVSEACGAALDSYGETRYLRSAARKSLRFYRADAVPQPVIELPLPAGVSWIRFQSDFSSAESVRSSRILGFHANQRSLG